MGGSTSQPKHGLLLLGLDGAGKTAIIEQLKRGEVVTSIPTIGFNVQTVEELCCKDMTITSWSCGGADKIRPLWYAPSWHSHRANSTVTVRRHYYAVSSAVVWVYNAGDSERIHNSIHNSRYELNTILNQDEIQGMPLLILVNMRNSGGVDDQGLSPRSRLLLNCMPPKSHWGERNIYGCYPRNGPQCDYPFEPVTTELIEDFFHLRKPVTIDWTEEGLTAFLMGTHTRAGSDSVLQRLCGDSNLLEHIWRFVQPLQRVQIQTVCTDRPWRVQECCALTGEGLQEGLNWLQAVLAKAGVPGKYHL